MEVNSNVNVGSVRPDTVPDCVGVRGRYGTTVGNAGARKDTVQICEETIIGAGEEIPLIQDIATGVHSWYANYSTIEVSRRDHITKSSENALYDWDAVELVAANGGG